MSDAPADRNGQPPAADDPRHDTQLLHAAVEGELSAEAAEAFERRLVDDPELARLVGELRAQREVLRGLPAAEPPAGRSFASGPRLERAVLLAEPVDAPAAGRNRTGGNDGFRFPTRWAAATAALAAVIALGVYVTGVGDDRPTLADMADRIRVTEPEPATAEEPVAAAAALPEAERLDALAEAPAPAEEQVPDAAPARTVAGGPSMQRAEEVGLDAFLLPEGGAAVAASRGAGKAAPLAAADAAAPAPEPEASGDRAAFQVNLLDSLSRGRRGPAVPAWAEAETYLKPLPPAVE